PIVLHDIRVNPGVLLEECLDADVLEELDLFRARLAGQQVDSAEVKPPQIVPRLRGQRRVGDERPDLLRVEVRVGKVDRIGLLRTELVDTEGAALEKARGLEPMCFPEAAIVVAIEAPDVYAELAQQPHGLGGVEL